MRLPFTTLSPIIPMSILTITTHHTNLYRSTCFLYITTLTLALILALTRMPSPCIPLSPTLPLRKATMPIRRTLITTLSAMRKITIIQRRSSLRFK